MNKLKKLGSKIKHFKIKKKTKPEKEGAFLSIAAVIAGIALIGSVYVISRRSTKLYKM